MDTNYIIETKNLTKQYGSQKSVADLNIHVKRGRIYGLLGRNGAGKTTTMKMLLGLTKPTSGEVKIWGKSLQGNEKKLLPRIGSLIESPGFYPNLTGTENLRIFATLRGVPNNHAIKDALDLVGLPYKDKKLFSQYSLGMKQRLAIALAVIPVVLACCVFPPNSGRRSINLRRRFTVKLTTQKLEQMRSVDIGAVAAESLPDVSGMTFDNALSRKERISRFLQTVKNPYCFCIGGVGVKIEFAESGPSLQDKLTDFLLRQRSGL